MENQRHIPRISEVLYVGLCDIIGTPTQVMIRRDVVDTIEMVHNSISIYKGYKHMDSGSQREGFRLKTSDVDTMIWFTSDMVICDFSQIPPYHPKQTLILMEVHDTPPGFAKLQLLAETNNLAIRQSCVSVNDQVYISSSLHREVLLHIFQSCPFYKSATLHGPCASGFIMDTIEYDYAFCFSCKQWPTSAYCWIDRCQKNGWPSHHVQHDIISEGCHLVAIGSGRSPSTQQCETEWRISFSQAEYKLVYSMNHTQFLCYGALKIFLKEVLNEGLQHPLLCSYFIKTAVLWKIQENTAFIWCPTRILHCVWMCFRYLTHCVYRGDLPNFFIPQNNMFINKIHGAAQKQVFLKLLTLYNMGFSCLLLSPSFYNILAKAIFNPQLQVNTDENNIISEVELDVELFREITMKSTAFFMEKELDITFPYVLTLDNLSKAIPSCSQNHIAALNAVRNRLFIHSAFILDKSKEENMHTTDICRPLDMLISAAESGFISDTLYVALYLYNKKRYTEALYHTEKTKIKLNQQYILDITSKNVNRESYMKVIRGQSLIEKVRKAGSSLFLIDQICCIDEVRLEVYVSWQNCVHIIRVPPLVMTHMLSFLCHHHLGDSLRSRQSIDDLHIMLHYREGYQADLDISWQILGICEEIYGNKDRALYSYLQSSIREPLHKINTASWIRIQNTVSKQNS